MTAPKFISPEDLESRHVREANLVLVDVRAPAEYRSLHVPRSVLAPMEGSVPSLLLDRVAGDATEIFLICRTGRRALKAATRIAKHARIDVYVVEGGLVAWEAAGLPVVRRRRTFPIEHRVRTAAGSLVLLGTALGIAIHPAFWGIPLLVGGGLLIAGLADTFSASLRLARQRHGAHDLQHPPA